MLTICADQLFESEDDSGDGAMDDELLSSVEEGSEEDDVDVRSDAEIDELPIETKSRKLDKAR